MPHSNTAILCCNTLEDEARLILGEAAPALQIVWIEAGLHNRPDKLRAHLNQTLSEIKAQRVLMALGHCGGACAGLKTFDFELVIPRVDDCISLLMGSMKKRRMAGTGAATFFLTAGWQRHSESLISNFARDSARFGPEKARRIYKMMLKHYDRFGFIETGAYDPGAEEEKIAPLAGDLDIALARLPGDLDWLERLLKGPWPASEFITVPPHSELLASDWDWLGETAKIQGM